MAAPNPFAGLLATPDTLSAQREARFNQNPGDSFWTVEAGRAGIDMRRNMMAQGRAMSPEDQRAITTQSIMGGAQKRLAELVKSGEMDPLDAQEAVMTETMSAFMQAGDYEAAQSLLPGINQIRTYKDEQMKLRSETRENLAQASNSTASAVATATKLPYQTAELEAKTDASVASAEERRAHADLYARTDPNRNRGKGGGGGKDPREFVSDKTRAEVQQAGAATMTLLSVMDDLTEYVDQAPRTASAVAGGLNYGNQYLAGIASMFKAKGMTNSGQLSARPEDGAEGISPKTIVASHEKQLRQAADSLSMDVTAFRSLVIDAAYALARANDPGGRLSNNDFDFSLQMLGAVQDPASAKNAFRKLVDRSMMKYNNTRRSFAKDLWEGNFGDMDAEVMKDYEALNAKWDSSGNRIQKGTGNIPADIEAILQRNKPK